MKNRSGKWHSFRETAVDGAGELNQTPQGDYMRRSVYAASLALLVLAAGGFLLDAQVGTVTVPPAVSKLLIPVLDAYEKARTDNSPRSEQEGGTLWKAVILAARVMDNKTPAADEALVVLEYFYIGEGAGGDNNIEIVDRGKRMLPYLKKYQARFPRIPGRDYKELLLPRETSQLWFREIIAAIERGDQVENDRLPVSDSR
jgi:hypothetical protein